MSRRPSRAGGPSTRRGRPRPAKDKYVLVLYVTGSSPLSMRAVQNLRNICDNYLEGCHKLEVIDLYSHPEEAATANVIAAPTMIKSLPLPVQRFVGDMSDRQSILARLRIKESK
jgi:circadian clock protein KaiB